jgi:sulfur carrier protein
MDGDGMTDLRVVVNGDERWVPGPASLLDLLARLGLDPRTVVVELNRQIVRRPRLGDTVLAEGDSVELVHFVGGG